LAGNVAFVFAYFDRLPGIDLAAGAFLFAVQLYADFSGYSDIAIGISRLLGIRVMRNFAYPYFSRDMAEFWRRWHISLSAWFRDYVYTPLSLNLSLKARARRMGCILLTFVASGLWHGAGWTFVVWGVLHGMGFAPLVLWKPTPRETKQAAQGCRLPTWREGFEIGATFAYVVLAWIFFRAGSLAQALGFLTHMLTHSWLASPESKWMLLLAAAFLLFEWMRREKEHPLDIRSLPVAVRWAVYGGLSFWIVLAGHLGQVGFIYMRF
jgi:D-alanyl-lipoteichoic acid acyltransferase DltB (MBOAT superfamily)